MVNTQRLLKNYGIPAFIIIGVFILGHFAGVINLPLMLFAFLPAQLFEYEGFTDNSLGANIKCQVKDTEPGAATFEECTTDKFIARSGRFSPDPLTRWDVINGNLILTTTSWDRFRQSNYQKTYFETSQNMKGNYVEMKYSRLEGGGQFLGGLKDFSGAQKTTTGELIGGICNVASGAGMIRCYSSDLDSTKYRCEDGAKETFCTFPQDEPIQFWFQLSTGIGGSSQVSIPEVRSKPARSCRIEQNDYVALESFRGGQELDKFSTRYFVKKYCDDLPVVITDPSSAFTTSEPYTTWIAGGKIAVPPEETWTVYYIFENIDVNGNTLTSTVCDFAKEVYNVAEDKCTPRGGIVQICSQGIFDPERQQCVTEPVTTIAGPLAGQEGITLQQAIDQVIAECAGTLIRRPDGSVECVTPIPVDQLCQAGTINVQTGTCLASDPTPCQPSETRRELSPGQFACVKSAAPPNPAKAIIRKAVTTTADTFGLSFAQSLLALSLIAALIWAIATGKVFRRRR